MTVHDLLLRSLQDLGMVPGGGAAPDPDDEQLAFDRLNDFIDDLKTEGLIVFTIARATWTLTSGTASYTVGIGGTVNIERPVSPNAIQNVGWIDTSVTPNAEYLVGPPLTEDEYSNIAFKTLQAVQPAAFYYNPTYPLGTLRPFPIPSTTQTGVIYAPAPVSEFVAVTDTIVLPPGYRRFFRNQLTVEIASAFEKNPPPAVVEAARDSRAKIKRTNERLTDLSFDAGLLPASSGYNIYTGE